MSGQESVEDIKVLSKKLKEIGDARFCPLLKEPCKKTRCEWWLVDRCSVKTLAYELKIGVKTR